MFGFLFRRAQATVDNAISQVVNRAIIAVPFIVAAGFLTAAAAGWLHRHYDAETAHLILASGFATIGLLTALILNTRGDRGGTDTVTSTAEQSAAGIEAEMPSAAASLSAADRELLMSTLSAAGPLALPVLFRFVSRNLPIIMAIVAAIFIFTRAGSEDGSSASQTADGDDALAPAE
ncbi:MAG: hypothetical protein ACK4MF_03350 [Hyphomicrobiaceae bacterium]